MNKTFSFVLALTSTVVAITGASSSGCTTSCTLIGCQDGVSFNVKGAANAYSAQLPVTMRLCAGATCRDLTLSQDGQGTVTCTGGSASNSCEVEPDGDVTLFLDASVDETVTATVEVKNEQGDTLFTKSIEVPIDPVYFNGEGCGETCRTGHAEFTPGSS